MSVVIPDPVFTVSLDTGKWRMEGSIPLSNWEGVLYVFGNPILRRTYLDLGEACEYPEVAAEYDDTASCLEDAEDKFAVLVAEMFKTMLATGVAATSATLGVRGVGRPFVIAPHG